MYEIAKGVSLQRLQIHYRRPDIHGFNLDWGARISVKVKTQ